ncbi:hypothetical protein, partial [Cohnella thermotolerans]|uniref:hypothetical protein n=1 Tax=Cohnella thermotolerans TaxID=329858 RepID=UPI00047CC1F7
VEIFQQICHIPIRHEHVRSLHLQGFLPIFYVFLADKFDKSSSNPLWNKDFLFVQQALSKDNRATGIYPSPAYISFPFSARIYKQITPIE